MDLSPMQMASHCVGAAVRYLLELNPGSGVMSNTSWGLLIKLSSSSHHILASCFKLFKNIRPYVDCYVYNS